MSAHYAKITGRIVVIRLFFSESILAQAVCVCMHYNNYKYISNGSIILLLREFPLLCQWLIDFVFDVVDAVADKSDLDSRSLVASMNFDGPNSEWPRHSIHRNLLPSFSNWRLQRKYCLQIFTRFQFVTML